MQAYFRYKFYSAVPSTNEVSLFSWVCSQVCPVLWLTSALYLIFPLVTFLSNFENKQKNWLDATAPSVNSNIRLGKRLPLDPALPEISTSWLAGNRFILCKRQLPHLFGKGILSGLDIAAVFSLREFWSLLRINLADLSIVL